MRPRKPSDIEKALLKKGFIKESDSHHHFYFLVIDGKKSDVYTYLSHGKKSQDYGTKLMGKVKKQLRFADNKKAELFFRLPNDRRSVFKNVRGIGRNINNSY